MVRFLLVVAVVLLVGAPKVAADAADAADAAAADDADDAANDADDERDAALSREIKTLETQLERQPTDVDARFKLAQRLAWRGDLVLAEAQANKVVAAAPSYWDAHVLLARLAAWTRRFAAARGHIDTVLASEPTHLDALTLAVDIELWSGRPDAARARVGALLAVSDTVDSRFRAARAADLAMASRATRRWARRTLELDADHRGAKSLLSAHRTVRFAAVTELEYFAIDNSTAVGQFVAATSFPASRWSLTVGYDYRMRFGTQNHRGQIGVAHRRSQTLAFDAMVRAGSTLVVPELTVVAAVRTRFLDHYRGSLEYIADKMPWPGQLHRVRLTAGAAMPSGFELGASYDAGVLRYCGETDPVQSLSVRGDATLGRWRAGVRYGFGMELDRAPLPPFIEDRFGDDVCSLEGEEGIDLSLRDTRAQFGGAQVGLERIGHYSLIAGYTIQYRLTGELVHLSFLSLGLWL